MRWDWRKERNEKHSFVEARLKHRPPVLAVALIFIVVWLSGLACSAVLLAQGMNSIAVRYALSTLVSYGVFVGAVGVWCRNAAKPVEPEKRKGSWLDGLDLPADEGCLVVLLVLVVALLLSGLFWMLGGYAMLFEVAFEVAFAGTVVRGIDRQYTLGNWASELIRRTWLPALVMGGLIVAIGGKLQHDHPQAQTVAQAIKAYRANGK